MVSDMQVHGALTPLNKNVLGLYLHILANVTMSGFWAPIISGVVWCVKCQGGLVHSSRLKEISINHAIRPFSYTHTHIYSMNPKVSQTDYRMWN
jgi:hypothetical protein